jgi:hypothetical protein
MDAISILALIVAVWILLDGAWIVFSPKGYVKKCKSVMKNQSGFIMVLSVVAAVVTGYYVLSVLTIVEVAAVVAFVGSVMTFSFVLHPNAMAKLAKTMAKNRNQCLMSLLPWAVGAVCVLYVLFA